MEIGKAFSLFGNLAIPACGATAGVVSANIHSEVTGLATIVGSALFGVITGFGPGERSHRYVGGVVAQVIPFVIGAMLHRDYPYRDHSFELGRFFVASAVSITAQIILRELCHLPEAFNKGGGNGSPQSSSRSNQMVGGEEEFEDIGGRSSGNSSDLIPFGVGKAPSGTLSTFVPRMEGLKVANPGTVIIGVDEEEHTRKHLFEGNTTFRRRKCRTAEGGSLEEHTYEHSGWLGSEKKSKREYTAGSGNYGNTTSSSGVNGPQIEEID